MKKIEKLRKKLESPYWLYTEYNLSENKYIWKLYNNDKILLDSDNNTYKELKRMINNEIKIVG